MPHHYNCGCLCSQVHRNCTAAVFLLVLESCPSKRSQAPLRYWFAPATGSFCNGQLIMVDFHLWGGHWTVLAPFFNQLFYHMVSLELRVRYSYLPVILLPPPISLFLLPQNNSDQCNRLLRSAESGWRRTVRRVFGAAVCDQLAPGEHQWRYRQVCRHFHSLFSRPRFLYFFRRLLNHASMVHYRTGRFRPRWMLMLLGPIVIDSYCFSFALGLVPLFCPLIFIGW